MQKQKEELSGDEIDWNSDLIPNKQLEENEHKHHHSSRERERKKGYYKDSKREKDRNPEREREKRKDYDRNYPSKPHKEVDQDNLRQNELVESQEAEKMKKDLEEKLKNAKNYTISLSKKNNDIRKLDSGINKPLDPPK